LGFIKILTYNLKTGLYDENLLLDATNEIKNIIVKLNSEDNTQKFNDDFVELLMNHVNEKLDISYLSPKNKNLGFELNLDINKFKKLSLDLLGINLDTYKRQNLEINIESNIINLKLDDNDFIIKLNYDIHGSIDYKYTTGLSEYIYNDLIEYYKK
jgi:hypothetical protein